MTWFVVFALSAFGLWSWRHYAVQQRDLESASSPQRKGERFIGQVVTVPKGIENGLGRVQLGPQKWSLRGPDVPAGAQVRITGVDGRVLIVSGASSVELRTKAIETGMLSLRGSGLQKIREGVTTVEEVVRETVL